MPYGEYSLAVPQPLSPEEQREIKLPADPWTDEYALKIVTSDWGHAESFRVRAHDWRFRNADELYLAWVPQRYWDGTRVPRSSLGNYTVFGQVESLVPKIISAVANPDSFNFFAVSPGEKDTDLEVIAWKELVSAQLDECGWREQLRRAIKSMCVQGNGILEVGVEEYEDENIEFSRQVRPTKLALMQHPQLGAVPVPAETKESFSRKVTSEKKMRPYVRYVSIKDFYVDPNLESTNLQDAGYVIKRVYMRAEEIARLRGQKDYNIPDDAYLAQLTHAKSTANQDVTKQAGEMFRYNLWNPAQDYTSDPAQQRIAVVEYTKPQRKIQWLQGGDDKRAIIYNQRNRYRMINFFSCCYADVLDRWHALSLADVTEGEQRLQVSIINSRVDELALAIHKPMVKRRGVTVPWYQLKVRPGVVIETESPEQDIKTMEVDNITQQSFIEVEASQRRTQQITGLSDLAALGSPSSGGNSANRTATGVNTQVGATQDRVKYLIENIEDTLVEPVVNAIVRFNRKFLDMQTASNWLKLDPRFQKLDPAKVMNTRVGVECRGSAKMAARAGFLQIFPQLAQTYLNPELLTLLSQQQQKTVNAEEILRMLTESINYTPRLPLIQDMTPQQIQAQQQPPAEAQMQAATQQAQMQSDEQINDKRLIAKLFETMLKSFIDAHTKHAQMDDTTMVELAKLAAGPGQADSGGAGKSSSGGQ